MSDSGITYSSLIHGDPSIDNLSEKFKDVRCSSGLVSESPPPTRTQKPMNRLQRHEAAQRASILEKEGWGYTCLSLSTKAPADYIMVKKYGEAWIPVFVEIKTGTGRLTEDQKALQAKLGPAYFTWERWEVNGFKKPVLMASG